MAFKIGFTADHKRTRYEESAYQARQHTDAPHPSVVQVYFESRDRSWTAVSPWLPHNLMVMRVSMAYTWASTGCRLHPGSRRSKSRTPILHRFVFTIISPIEKGVARKTGSHRSDI